MPEMRFVIRWPDGRRESCYSPSLVIRDFLREGESYPVPDFLQRSREALQIASERVKAKYGHACSLALGQLARIEADSHTIRGAGRRARSLRNLSRRRRQMSTEQKIERRYGAIVVGGGQAGLSASYWLSRAGVDHVVFEKKSIMHKWREERWDTFCLVTPNWQCQLPGHAYEGPDPHGFMVKQEILAYLDGFARKTNGSVREGVEVLAVEREKDLFLVTTSAGRFLADAVFLATSLYGDPYRPRCAERVPDSSPRFTRPNIATPPRCRRAPSSSSGRASPGRRSPRICISTAGRCTSSPAMRHDARASIAAATSSTG